MRIDLDYKDGAYSNLRSIQQLDLPSRQLELEDIISKAQDTLNELSLETDNQKTCLGSIDNLFEILETYKKPEAEEVPEVLEMVMIKKEDKGIQVGSSSENLPYFRDLEYKFYKRMMESFNHLRFTAEVSSVHEIVRPKSSMLLGNSEV